MNSWQYHIIDRDPLGVFLGFRGHPRQYSEIITPGIYRAHNRLDENSARRYQRKARVASNVAKQAVFEQQNIVLTNVQARGLLQHYGIIGATDVLDLTFDVNVAKWFALNMWDQEGRRYCPRCFDLLYNRGSLQFTQVAFRLPAYALSLGILSTASLACLGCYGLLSLPAGIIAIILGAHSLREIARRPDLPGRRQAIWGIVCGALGALVTVGGWTWLAIMVLTQMRRG